MKTTVKGTQITYGVSIVIDEKDIIKALWEIAGLSELSVDLRDYYWERKPDKLVEVGDISYYGSPNWIPTGKEITDPIKLKLYDQIIGLVELLKEQKN